MPDKGYRAAFAKRPLRRPREKPPGPLQGGWRTMQLQRGLFGSYVRKSRLDKKLTQEKLAELIGITPTHLKQLESERRKPSVDVLFNLAYTLDLSLDSLLSNTQEDTQELRNRINICLDRCSVHEQRVVYAAVEAMLDKNE